MKKILINYADSGYERSRKLNSWTGLHIAGFDEVREYSRQNLDEEFRHDNAKILSLPRGAGEWLWKPYVILNALERAEIGDIVFYADSGSFFIRKIDPILDLIKSRSYWIARTPLIEKQFTKQLTFALLGCTEPKYQNSAQANAGFLGFRVNTQSIQFVQDWLSKCCNSDVLLGPTDPSGEEPFFIAHREDQSVISLLAKKNNMLLSDDPTQYGQLPEKYSKKGRMMLYTKRAEYHTLIIQHRESRPTFSTAARQILCGILPRKIGLKIISQSE